MVKLLKEANRIITLWRTYGPNEPKIDLEISFYEIVLPSSFGDICNIVYESFDSFEGLMARQAGAKEWRIGINKNISYRPRRNFTLAHEMGHFIGHRYKQDLFQCSIDNMNDFQNEGLEKEANEFAAHLLMPPDIVRRFDSECIFSHEAVSDLAAKQGVSRAAAAYRWIALSSRRIGFAISRDGFFNNGRASDKAFREGVFFRQGDEVPARSLITQVRSEGEETCLTIDARVWHEAAPCHESTFATTQGGYIYTYLDFDLGNRCPNCLQQ
jgi:hypothetical protein